MELHFERRGSGPPLVLVPGTSCDAFVWSPVIDRLAARRDVIAVDMPGFGRSAPLPDGVRPDPPALARALAEFLDGLGLRRPHVAGSSLGGAIVLELARLGRAASVCASAPIGFWTDREAAYCVVSVLANGRGGAHVPDGVLRRLLALAPIRAALFTQIFAHPERVSGADAFRLATVPKPGLEAIADAYRDYRFPRDVELDCPVTVLWGCRDRLVLAREGRRVPRVLPQARMVWLADAGHLPMWDAPGATADELLEASALA